jgi:hypothetical protein
MLTTISVAQQRTDWMLAEGYFCCIAERRRYVPRSLGIESYHQKSRERGYEAATWDNDGRRRGRFKVMSLNELTDPKLALWLRKSYHGLSPVISA